MFDSLRCDGISSGPASARTSRSSDRCSGADATAWVVPPVVARTIRADFRINFFVHRSSRVYNYDVSRYMFDGRTEARSARRGRVALLPLLHDSTPDVNLYSSEIPLRVYKAVNYIWKMGRFVWLVYVEIDDDDETSHAFSSRCTSRWRTLEWSNGGARTEPLG